MADDALWLVELIVPAAGVAVFQRVLDGHAEAVSVFEEKRGTVFRIAGYTETAPDRAAIEDAAAIAATAAGLGMPTVRIERMKARDWLAENRRDLGPVRAGRFYVRPSHHAGPTPLGATEIVLDAGPAFGGGGHETTHGCLLALDRLGARRGFRPARTIDLGCGSGILAIAMAKLWSAPVEAVDHDPVAVETTAVNAARNGVAALVAARLGEAGDRAMLGAGRFDLIAANILANPLIAFAPALARALAPGGFFVLSGILRNQERAVRAAYRAARLRPSSAVRLGEWPTLILRRPG